jgi:hypothetical protein
MARPSQARRYVLPCGSPSCKPGRQPPVGVLLSPLKGLTSDGRSGMAEGRRYGPGGGLTLGGIIVIVGIVLMFVWSFWIGLIIALVGLIAFGGFARGRWY